MTHPTRGRGRGRRWRLALAAIAAMVPWLVSSGPAGAQARPERLVVGLTAASGSAGGIFAAQEDGLFREEGLDVELVPMSTAALSIPALLSGQVSILTGVAGPPLVNAALAGGDVVWVAELLGTMPYALVAGPAIERPADLRGRRVGISRFGTSSDFVARYMLARVGLDPARDATLVQAGSSDTRLAALVGGSIDATVLPPELLPPVARLGLRTLADTLSLGLRYPQEGIVTTRALLRSRPDTVRRFLRAVVTGTHRFKTSRADGLRLLRKYLRLPGDAAVDAAYDVYAPITLQTPYLDVESVRFVLDDLAARDPRARSLAPESLMDMRFVRELEESGFIARLEGRPGPPR